MYRLGISLWVISLMLSIAALLFYRARPGHGPDVVANEVFAFTVPLLTAALISGLLFFIGPSSQEGDWSFLLVTVAIGIIESVVYFGFVM